MEIWSPGSGIGRAWIAHGLLTVAAIAAAAYAFRRNSSRYRNRAVGIIPARYKSSRFDGKPLVQILGKPMIQVSLYFSLSSALDLYYLNFHTDS
ncbi:hypothetical protein AMTR_s00058p00144000 [Amborella trichopoda]|uniref:Uncharacterized protein n=1 Tax=Amborella trichopoda TaxID=13333 RepID=W1P9K0_AMBTC|nr:hypothetical protein AMTR_s00058p00144000 [Amborella trichopoda]